MNEILRQRLVGALILLALGVVFWPIIFVDPDSDTVAVQESIPPPPQVSSAAIEAPRLDGLRGSPALESESPLVNPPVAEVPAEELVGDRVAVPHPAQPEVAAGDTTPDSGAVRSQAPERLNMDSAGVPEAWTLQVATVSSAEKAEVLRKRLLQMNHKAYTARVSSGGKTLYRICIGPKFERAELQKLQAPINAEFGVTSMVVRYIP